MFTSNWWRLAPHHHTGKALPHQHTSYPALVFLLLLVGIILAGVSFTAAAEDQSGQPSSFQNFAVVPGPVPTTAPQITNISGGQTFSSVPTTVEGSCPANTLVKIYKNDVLAGSVLCGSNQRFSLPIDLFIGSNALIVRAYNTNDQASPDSKTITVQFVPPGNQGAATQLNAPGAPGNQFFITAQVFYRGAEAGQITAWPLTITGGQAPYAISVGWGDGTTDLYSRGSDGPFQVSHTYGKAGKGYHGSYPIVIQGTDANGLHAYLQLVALISDKNTKPIGAGTTGTTNKGGFQFPSFNGGLNLAWPLFIIAVLMVLSFLLGEWREKRIMSRRLPPPPPIPPAQPVST